MAPKLQSKDLRNSKGSNAGSDATGIVETMGRPTGAEQRRATRSKAKEHQSGSKTEKGVWEDNHRTFKTLRLVRSEAKSTCGLEGSGQKASGRRGKEEPLPLTSSDC